MSPFEPFYLMDFTTLYGTEDPKQTVPRVSRARKVSTVLVVTKRLECL